MDIWYTFALGCAFIAAIGFCVGLSKTKEKSQ